MSWKHKEEELERLYGVDKVQVVTTEISQFTFNPSSKTPGSYGPIIIGLS